VDSAFDSYEFSRACESLYHFAWDEFCDWYVELAKVQLAEGVQHTTAVLAAVLDTLLKLLHPVIAVRHRVFVEDLDGGESIVMRRLAAAVGVTLDSVAGQRVADMQKLITRSAGFAATRASTTAAGAGTAVRHSERRHRRADPCRAVAGVAHRE